MGKSAKMCKRVKKTASSVSQAIAQKPSATASAATIQHSKKKANLKQKAQQQGRAADGPVLGGADYVDLMMGSRKKAREQAAKLPPSEP
ncbi:hypothetical protein BD626DRAFT_401781 [Schizophyllum amplum]|uniref:Uncharacterized protein n=1 Tax=Schizophyllum amplum TaxID=97359 RepID=A0A550CH83_9AGAR|nr:hypothetical protein BD626DRAFT_401781 [Auriculariopsis ampla]